MPSGRKLILDLHEAGEVEYADLSATAGMSHSYIQQFISRGVPRELPEKVRVLLAPKLGVHPDALRESDPPQISSGKAPIVAQSEVRKVDLEVPTRSSMPRDLPVYGTAAGGKGDGAFMFSMGEIVDLARRPPGLEANRAAYALYVEGESMEPALRHGDLIYVDPSKKLRRGDRVVIVAISPSGERVAYVKEVVRESPDKLVVQQFNPPKELTFARKDVVSVHRILTTAEMMGV